MAGSKSLTYEIGIDAGDAVGTLRTFSGAVKSAMRDVESELEDGATSGEKLARALEEIGQKSKEEFSAAAVAAEEMGAALKRAGSSLDVADVLPQLQRLGLSFEEITADADKLAVSLKSLDDIKATGLKDLDSTAPGLASKLDEVNKSADSSKSALANMIGNSAQDMGAAAGIAGSLGVGIGQIAEYAADAKFSGESLGSTLKNMAAVAGPMAALGVAIEVMNAAMASAAASRAFNAANVEQYTNAIKEGTPIVESFNDEIRETNELQYRSQTGGGPLGMFSSTKDLLPVLERASLKVADFSKIVDEYVEAGDGSAEMNDRIRASLEEQGVEYLDAIRIVRAANAEADARVEAGEKVARTEELVGDAVGESAEELEAAEAITDALTQVQEELAAQAQAAADALLAQADALNAQVEAATAAADQQLAVNDALARYGELLGDAEASSTDVRDAAIDLAKATADLRTKQAEANGVTLTATQRLDNQNDALLDTAAAASGPARSGILDYIASVNQIPPEKVTEIEAAIAQGDLETAKRLLDEASAPRRAAMNADANTAQANRELDTTARPRDVIFNAKVIGLSAMSGAIAGALRPGTTAAAPASVGVGATATTVPVVIDVGLPSAAEIARRIGRVRLPFAVASSLAADQRLGGARDL